MRFFAIFLAILSCSSFDLRASPTGIQDFYQMMVSKKRDSWMKSAITAGINDQQPEHLSEILDFESLLFAEFLNTKEKKLKESSKEWQKHTLATLLSFQAITQATRVGIGFLYNSVMQGSLEKSLHDDFEDHPPVKDVPIPYLEESTQLFLKVSNAIEEVIHKKGVSSGMDTWTDFIESELLVEEPMVVGQEVVKLAVNHEDRLKMRRIAYRVVETHVWATILDPSRGAFEKAYELAYLRLDKAEGQGLFKPFYLKRCFVSKRLFGYQMNKFFIDNDKLDQGSKRFLIPLVENLEHIKDRYFYLKSSRRTSA